MSGHAKLHLAVGPQPTSLLQIIGANLVTGDEFTHMLDECGYAWFRDDNRIVVTSYEVKLSGLNSLPNGICFRDAHSVSLNNLALLPEAVRFENCNSIYMNSLASVPEGFCFENQGHLSLDGMTSLPKGTQIRNCSFASLNGLTEVAREI